MLSTCEVIGTAGRRPLGEAFARDVLRGLSRQPKRLSSAWFYDERGSRLFEQITRLDEYYLTGCEREILTTHAPDLAKSVGGDPFRLIEIGAGDGHKTEILLHHFLHEGLAFEYVPIDICERSVVGLVHKLRHTLRTSGLKVRGIVADYSDALSSLARDPEMRSLVLFLGSSIGNFTHHESLDFLRGLHDLLRPGDLLLMGFDLKKDAAILQRAYDDSLGVTREFNLNLLDRINRELGGDFDRWMFRHQAVYNHDEGCMESYLVSRAAQRVSISALGRRFAFHEEEAIHVERSCKYDLPQIESFATESGFGVRRHFFDRRHWFLDSLWGVE
jgi:L-histidine Nalpha-methyltransferase